MSVQGTLSERGRLRKVNLLIKVACSAKMETMYVISKTADPD
jgi:hypothetical protein